MEQPLPSWLVRRAARRASFAPVDGTTVSVVGATGGSYEALNTTDTATVTVVDMNGSPNAIDDAISTAYGVPVQIPVLANDTDPDGDSFAITANSNPAHGTVVLNANGTFTYTPTSGYSGADSFTYTISDGNGGTDMEPSI